MKTKALTIWHKAEHEACLPWLNDDVVSNDDVRKAVLSRSESAVSVDERLALYSAYQNMLGVVEHE
jgi:hypothetical protein